MVCGCKEPTPPAAAQPGRLPTAEIRIGQVPVRVEVARTEPDRRRGMMFRRTLGPEEIMLFVFPTDEVLSFWMKNTYVNLELAYIRSDGTIAQVEPMQARDLAAVRSREPALFALELPPGWLEAHGLGVGTKVTIPAAAAAPPQSR